MERTKNTEREKIAEILVSINAISLNPTHPFKYASGMLSPIYTDCRVLSSYPNERRVIIDHLVRFITRVVGLENIDAIIGTAHSGIPLATYLAQRLELPMAYVRTSIRDHGKSRQIEGIIKSGQKVLLVSDIMSTEKDIQIAVEAIGKVGARIVYCLTIYSNNLGFVEDFLEKEEIQYCSLTDLDTLLRAESMGKMMSPAEKSIVLEWMRNPMDWNRLREVRIEEMLGENKEKIAQMLLEIEAVTLNTEEPWRFSSGILSPVYTDNRLLFSYPDKWKEVIDSFVGLIVNKIGVQNVDIICGTSTAGIPHAAYLAQRLGIPMIYVKSKKDEHGKFTRIEGHLERNDKVLIIEDLVTSGRSSISCAKAIREAGGIVENCLVIFTYGLDRSTRKFERERIELTALTDLKTLLDLAIKENHIKPEEKRIILEWVREPGKWDRE